MTVVLENQAICVQVCNEKMVVMYNNVHTHHFLFCLKPISPNFLFPQIHNVLSVNHRRRGSLCPPFAIVQTMRVVNYADPYNQTINPSVNRRRGDSRIARFHLQRPWRVFITLPSADCQFFLTDNQSKLQSNLQFVSTP